MPISFRFYFALALILSSTHNSRAQNSNKLSKTTKLLDLQSNINGFRNSEKIVNAQIEFAEKNSKTKILKDPKVANQLIIEIDEAYTTEMTQKLSDKDLDYLILLYSSPLYQKYIKLEKDFWNNRVPRLMNDKISLYQKNAPKK